MKLIHSLVLICICAGAIGTACADVSAQDVQIAARALGFLEKPLSGTVHVGIVYAPGSPQSVQAATELQGLLGNGLRAGNLLLMPVLVSIDEVEHSSAGLLFLTEGVGPLAANLAAVTKARQIPCVTVDLAQVHSGACMLGVRSQPKVEILVNRKSAADSGASFAAVFRMMITEL